MGDSRCERRDFTSLREGQEGVVRSGSLPRCTGYVSIPRSRVRELNPIPFSLEVRKRETRRDLTINLRCFPASCIADGVAAKIEFHLNLMKYLIKSAFETRDRESAYRYLRPTLLESAHKVVTTTDWIGERKREGEI